MGSAAGYARLLQLYFVVILVTSSGHVILSESINRQIETSSGEISRLAKYVLEGSGRHETYNRLAALVDKFGHRVTGSDVLERSIDYVAEELRREGFANVHKEPVTVPKWVRGNENARLISPRNQSLPILGLGSSVGTNGPLEADVIVVTSFQDLENKSDQHVAGKIVVFNQPWMGRYRQTVPYRTQGASKAARKGAVAALVRSVTDFSLHTPHTGQQRYDDDVAKIPVACITVEDAEMLDRMYRRNESVRIRLYMEARNENNATSHNLVAEIPGYEFPDTTVIVGGHIDSWDVGTGAMDDGGGLMISWQALSLIKRLKMRPRRTMRLVLWTAEEQGLMGAEAYYRAHQNESSNVSLIMESDHGTFKPKGIGFTGSGSALAIMEQVMRLLAPYNTTTVLNGSGSSSDTLDWLKAGVPGVELLSANENYFYYHHTHADTMTVLNADDLDMCTVVWATAAYAVANLDDLLPRTGDYTSTAAGSPIGYAKPVSVTLLAGGVAMTIAASMRP